MEPANQRDVVEAWKEVHQELTQSLAVTLTKDAINAEKAKRRYIVMGNLLPTSTWGAKVAPKKVQSEDGVAPCY